MPYNPPPNWPTPAPGWAPDKDWSPDPSWPPAPPGWQFWVSDQSGQSHDSPTADFSAPPAAPAKRRVPLVIIAVLLVGLIGAYVARNDAANDVQAVLHQWATTWDLPQAEARVEARNQITCAENQIPLDNSQQNADSTKRTQSTIDVHSGTTEIGIGPLLGTAYAVATLTQADTSRYDSYGNYPATTSTYGFELIKENGQWKVCDWGVDVENRYRMIVLGWKLSGPPSKSTTTSSGQSNSPPSPSQAPASGPLPPSSPNAVNFSNSNKFGGIDAQIAADGTSVVLDTHDTTQTWKTKWSGLIQSGISTCSVDVSGRVRDISHVDGTPGGYGIGLATLSGDSSDTATLNGVAAQYDFGQQGYRVAQYPSDDAFGLVSAPVDHDWHNIEVAINAEGIMTEKIDGAVVINQSVGRQCGSPVIRVWAGSAEFAGFTVTSP